MASQHYQDLPKLVRIVPEKPKPREVDLGLFPTQNPKNTNNTANNNNNSVNPMITLLAPRRQPQLSPQTQGNQSVLAPSSNQNTSDIKLREEDVKSINKKIKVEKVPVSRDKKGLRNVVEAEEDKSKNLISQIIGKITGRNIAEEMVPISNETINKLINQIESEKQLLVEKAELVQEQLDNSVNKTNSSLKKELEEIEASIQRYETIKLLYLDKVSLRNENRRLLTIIQQLKKENKDLKSKISQGITQIQAHMHNLPCEREKELATKLAKFQQQLQAEREMRMTLESNISNTVDNFNRLYEEADSARLIIITQLKEIQLKNQNMHKKEVSKSFLDPLQSPLQETSTPTRMVPSQKGDMFLNTNNTNPRQQPLMNTAFMNPHNQSVGLANNTLTSGSTNRKTPINVRERGYLQSDSNSTSQRFRNPPPTNDYDISQNRPVTPTRVPAGENVNMQDMLKRMRANQSQLAKKS